jgi:hypothetical protein
VEKVSNNAAVMQSDRHVELSERASADAKRGRTSRQARETESTTTSPTRREYGAFLAPEEAGVSLPEADRLAFRSA